MSVYRAKKQKDPVVCGPVYSDEQLAALSQDLVPHDLCALLDTAILTGETVLMTGVYTSKLAHSPAEHHVPFIITSSDDPPCGYEPTLFTGHFVETMGRGTIKGKVSRYILEFDRMPLSPLCMSGEVERQYVASCTYMKETEPVRSFNGEWWFDSPVQDRCCYGTFLASFVDDAQQAKRGLELQIDGLL